MKRSDKGLIMFIVTSFILLGMFIYALDEQEKDFLIRLESYKMYNGITSNSTGIDGVYFIGQDYYCIRPQERDYTIEQETIMHEHCHYLIEQDKEHFCEEDLIE